MAIESQHPEFQEILPAFTLMRDNIRGEDRIKSKTTTYLKATESMELDGMKAKQTGKKNYDLYLDRAVFPDYVKETLPILVGLLGTKPPAIKLPTIMEPLRDKATSSGESLEILLQRIYLEQLSVGRLGLLVDIPASASSDSRIFPYISIYNAEAIPNWDDGEITENKTELKFVCLDESNFKIDSEFNWTAYKKFRILKLDGNQYKQGVFDETNGLIYSDSTLVPPTYYGKTFNEIPFVFINTSDLLPSPDLPPLYGLGKLCLTIYKTEADYRYHLHLMSQETLVVIGGVSSRNDDGKDEPLRIGAGARIDVEQGGDAKFIGVDSTGLSEEREAIQNDRKLAEAKGVQLVPDKNQVESGEALTRRIGSKTASLKQIAVTGAYGLEIILKKIAVLMNANPDEVEVKPNLEFSDMMLKGSDIMQLLSAKDKGAPISMRSIHTVMTESKLVKYPFDEELKLIKEEKLISELQPTPPPEPEISEVKESPVRDKPAA